MFRLLKGFSYRVVGGDSLGSISGPGPTVPVDQVKKKDTSVSTPTVQTLPVTEIKEEPTGLGTDQSLTTTKTGVSVELLTEIEKKTQKDLPTPEQMGQLQDMSQQLDQFVVPPAPPLPTTPKQLTPEQTDRIVKGAIALSKLPAEKLAVLPEKDRQFLADLSAKITGTEKYKPNPEEVKELQRIGKTFQDHVLGKWQPSEHRVGADRDMMIAELNALDESVRNVLLQPLSDEYKDVKSVQPGQSNLKEIANGLKIKEHLSGLAKVVDLTVKENDKNKLAGVIQENFTDLVKDLDGTILKKNKDKIYAQAQDYGEQLGKVLDRKSEFYKGLQSMSVEDRKDAIVRSMGLIKDKWQGASYGELSESKQKLVDAILTGLNKGLQAPADTNSKQKGPDNDRTFRDNIGALNQEAEKAAKQMIASVAGKPELLAKMALTNDQDLRWAVAIAIGHPPDQPLSGLSKTQMNFLDKVVTALKNEAFKAEFTELKDKAINSPEEAQRIGKEFAEKAVTSGDRALSLSMRSDGDLKNAIAAATRNGQSYEELSTDQKQQVDNILTGIKSALPIKVGEGKVTVNIKDWGNYDVPPTFTVNGKTYGEPQGIAKGGGGIVIKYFDKETGESIAVKRATGGNEALVSEISAHHNAMGPDGHENILGMKGAVHNSSDGNLYMVMDLVNGPNLTGITKGIKALQDKDILSTTDEILVRQYLAKGAMDGMIHVQETRDMMHLDLKPDNIMFDMTTGKVKIMDFGESRSEQVIKGEMLGTGHYMTPEMDRREQFDKRSDTFSLGQVFHELVTDKLVFGNLEQFASDVQARNAKFTGPALKEQPSLREGSTDEYTQSGVTAFGEVINRTFTSNIVDRAKLSELRMSPFFTDTLGSDERAEKLLKKIAEYAKAKTEEDKTRIEGELKELTSKRNI